MSNFMPILQKEINLVRLNLGYEKAGGQIFIKFLKVN